MIYKMIRIRQPEDASTVCYDKHSIPIDDHYRYMRVERSGGYEKVSRLLVMHLDGRSGRF